MTNWEKTFAYISVINGHQCYKTFKTEGEKDQISHRKWPLNI